MEIIDLHPGIYAGHVSLCLMTIIINLCLLHMISNQKKEISW